MPLSKLLRATSVLVLLACVTASSFTSATGSQVLFHQRQRASGTHEQPNGGIAVMRAASAAVSDAVKMAAGIGKPKSGNSFILPPAKLPDQCVTMNTAQLPNFHLEELAIEENATKPPELTEEDLTNFVKSYVSDLKSTLQDIAGGVAGALGAGGGAAGQPATPTGQTPTGQTQNQNVLQPQPQPTSPNPNSNNNNRGGGFLRSLLDKVNFGSKPQGTVSMAELDSSMQEELRNMVGAPLTQFCEYYKKNEFINKETFVAAKLNQLNILKYVAQLVTKIAVMLTGRIVARIAAATCSFYNSVINKKVCTFGPYANGHAYLVNKYLRVPCFKGLSPGMCYLDDVYIPLPGKDFVPVDDLYKCVSLSRVLPQCNRKKVVAALSNAQGVVQGLLDTMWKYIAGFFTYGITKLAGVHDVLIAILEYMCVMREKPALADIGSYCRPVLAPVFNIGTTARNAARIPFWKFLKNPAVWKKIGQRVAKAAGKLIPVLQWLAVPLDEVGREIRRLACVRAITSAGELRAGGKGGGKVDLTYGETYTVEQYPEAEQFIKDAPEKFKQFMEEMVSAASTSFVDFLVSKAK